MTISLISCSRFMKSCRLTCTTASTLRGGKYVVRNEETSTLKASILGKMTRRVKLQTMKVFINNTFSFDKEISWNECPNVQ